MERREQYVFIGQWHQSAADALLEAASLGQCKVGKDWCQHVGEGFCLLHRKLLSLNGESCWTTTGRNGRKPSRPTTRRR